MVAREDDDGVVFEVVLLQPREDAPERVVDGRHELVVMGDLAADFGGVGVEGREFDLRRVAAIRGLERAGVPRMGGVVGADLAFVADAVVDVGEERLLRWRRLQGRLVPVVDQELTRVGQVLLGDALEVRLPRPQDEVTRFAELLGERAGWVDHLGAHVLPTPSQGVDAADHPAAGRRADATMGERPGEQGPFLGQSVHVGRHGILAAIGTRVGPHVFADHQHDVRTRLGRLSTDKAERR